MEISKVLKEFLLRPNVQELINNNEFSILYESILSVNNTVELSNLFLKANIDFLKYMKAIPARAFMNNRNIVYFIIPNNIKVIDYAAFYNSSIKKIKIPKSVSIIEEHAFGFCDNLESIEYEGTEEEWKKIQGVDLGYINNRLPIKYNVI